eukprot:scaffold186425_cov21-Prasinocladus_malaysianus.AAC.3
MQEPAGSVAIYRRCSIRLRVTEGGQESARPDSQADGPCSDHAAEGAAASHFQAVHVEFPKL